MERSTGDKGLALEALLLFHIQLVCETYKPHLPLTVVDNCCYVVGEEKRSSVLLSWHGNFLRWNTADSYSRTNFLNSEPTIYHILSSEFVLRLKTAASLRSLGTASYLLLIVCFSSCTADVVEDVVRAMYNTVLQQ